MVTREPSDPEDDVEFREALRAVAGTITAEEAERWIRNIYRWREEGSRPMHMITPSRAADDPVWAMLTPERIAAATRAISGATDTDANQLATEPQEKGRE